MTGFDPCFSDVPAFLCMVYFFLWGGGEEKSIKLEHLSGLFS